MWIELLILLLAASTGNESAQRDIARKIKNGNQTAFKAFFDQHYDSLFRFLLSHNVAKEVAEDLIQNAFMYIWDNRNKIDPDKSLRAYLFQIGYTRLLNHFRDNKKFDTSEAVPQQSSELTPEDAMRGSQLKTAINKAISQMPKKRKAVFRLCFVEELTYREAAETLGITRKTVENHMGLAFKDIRASLSHFRPEK